MTLKIQSRFAPGHRGACLSRPPRTAPSRVLPAEWTARRDHLVHRSDKANQRQAPPELFPLNPQTRSPTRPKILRLGPESLSTFQRTDRTGLFHLALSFLLRLRFRVPVSPSSPCLITTLHPSTTTPFGQFTVHTEFTVHCSPHHCLARRCSYLLHHCTPAFSPRLSSPRGYHLTTTSSLPHPGLLLGTLLNRSADRH